MPLDGTVLGGRFVLGELIGSGGYGEVWRATDTVLGRPVAVKLLHPRHAQRAEIVARFRAEARYAGMLSHENVAHIYDYREPASGRPPYLVMELVDGPSLEAVLAGGPLDSNRTMAIIAQAAAGLQAAHAAGMIHRDVKPGNLLLAAGGTVKITDFGIAHTAGSSPVTAIGELAGTPAYLAPERVAGEQATPASDLYSLGIVAYECLAGARPFTGSPLAVALAQRERPLPPLPPAVSADVVAFVMRLTAKDPAYRPGSAAEVAAWAALLSDGPANLGRRRPARAQGQAGALHWLRRRPVLACTYAALAAVVMIMLAGVTGFAATPRPDSASTAPAAPTWNSSRDSPRPGRPSASPVLRPTASPVTSSVARQDPVSRPQAVLVAIPGRDNRIARTPGRGDGRGEGDGNGHDDNGGSGHGDGDGSGRGD